MLSDGDVTPKIAREFKTHCTTFFLNAKDGMPNDQKVAQILGVFDNGLISDWANTHKDRLVKLTFPEFMKEFCEQWLPDNWEQSVHTQMLNSRLNLSQ